MSEFIEYRDHGESAIPEINRTEVLRIIEALSVAADFAGPLRFGREALYLELVGTVAKNFVGGPL